MGILKYFTIAFPVLIQVIALFYEKAKLSLIRVVLCTTDKTYDRIQSKAEA